MRPASIISTVLILGFLSAIAYCGRKAGQWENDSGNWERAFGSPPPSTIQIIHSIYSRSPHPITLEQHYAFHIKSSPSLPREWANAYKLKLTGPEDERKVHSLNVGQPLWFAPKPMREYEIFIPSDREYVTFGILIDRENGEWFVTDRS